MFNLKEGLSNLKKGLTWKGKSVEELRRRITRAISWRELFPSRKQEKADFIDNLVGTAKAEYEGNQTLREYRVEHLSEGDLHILERTTPGSNSTFQKLRSNGNVVMIFNLPNGLSRSYIVTPDVGNVDHNFTVANTVLPDREILKGFNDKELQAVTGTYLSTLIFYIKGKPAVKGWEEVMLYNDHLPQRIGHRIFPNFVLEAQSRLLQAYPQYFK